MKLKHQRIIGYFIMAIIVIGSGIIIGNYIANAGKNMETEPSLSVSTLKVANPLSITNPSCNEDNTDCCDNSGWYYCEPNLCFSTEGACWNWKNNKDISCDLDETRCCVNQYSVYDFTVHKCCSINNPYNNHNGGCLAVYQTVSDNYFTRNSECILNEEKCEGFDYFNCLEESQWLYKWNNQGNVIGKCEYECSIDAQCTNGICENNQCVPIIPECSTNSDCPVDKEIDKVCDGNNLMSKILTNDCLAGKCYDSFKFNLIESCKNGCIDGKCKGSFPTIIIFIVMVLIIGGIIYFYKR